MDNRVFFPQLAIDQWGIDGKVDLSQDELILLSEGRRYKVEESVRVVREVTGADDEHKLVGKVKPKAFLASLGAEILENSMILGDNAYDVVPGWTAAPVEPWSPASTKTGDATARSEEQMLRSFAEGAA
jgi:hypothetical protein